MLTLSIFIILLLFVQYMTTLIFIKIHINRRFTLLEGFHAQVL